MKKLLMFVVMIMMFMVGCKSEELNFGKKLVKVNGMVDILVELDSKNSDVGVMDSIMAGYYINEQYKGKLMIVPNLELADEEYGIAARKDGAYTAKMISNAIIELSKEGKVLEIAKKYGIILNTDELNNFLDSYRNCLMLDFDRIKRWLFN